VARVARRIRVIAVLAVAGVALSSCGNGGAIADARTSCKSVDRAITLQKRSDAPNISASQRRTLRQNAMSTLLKATPSAAAATSIDGSWNALMTTINEAERVPLENLVPSLTRLCQVAQSTSPYL
jgi:uncharacterized protein YqgV (UPF0045/DUF77 family)